MRKVALAFGLIALLALSNTSPPPVAHAQTALSFDEPAARTYVDKLVSDYNAMVNANQYHWANFSTIERYFYLYLEPADTWEVWVAENNESNTVGQIYFLFDQRVGGATPQITFFTNETETDLTQIDTVLNQPASLQIAYYNTPYGIVDTSVTIHGPTGTQYIPLLWLTYTASVYNDTLGINAEDAAQAIYNLDSSRAVNSTLTTTTTNNTISSPQQVQGPPAPSSVGQSGFSISSFLRNPVTYVIGAATLFFLSVQAYFGSIRDFVVVLGNPEERGKVIQELRDLRQRKKIEEKKKGDGNPKK